MRYLLNIRGGLLENVVLKRFGLLSFKMVSVPLKNKIMRMEKGKMGAGDFFK